MKRAFLFPGQGSQKVGMVHDLYTRYDAVKKLIGEADERLGFSISKLMFEGPDAELMKTEFTQPAILTASVAVWTVLKEHGVTPDVVAGHSLGEYSALVAAGVMSFSDAVHTVHLRGKYMQEAVPLGEGGMAAIIALKPEIIEEICEKISAEGKPVQAVNYNCPGQVVIAGATEAVKQACVEMKEAGAKMAIMLKVSAPFHSTLMEPAAVYANYTAKPELKADEIRKNLIMQAAHPVLWDESVRNMIADGADLMIEAGPGTVLSGFMKRISRRTRTLHAEDAETIENVLTSLEAE